MYLSSIAAPQQKTPQPFLLYWGLAVEEHRNRKGKIHSFSTAALFPLLLRRSARCSRRAPQQKRNGSFLFYCSTLLLRRAEPHQSEFLVLLSHPLCCLSCPCETQISKRGRLLLLVICGVKYHLAKLSPTKKLIQLSKYFFLMWPPLARRHLSEPPSLVNISIIITFF